MKRKTLLVICTLLVLAMVFSACAPVEKAAPTKEAEPTKEGEPEEAAPTEVVEVPLEGKTLVVGVAAGSAGLDPDFHSGRARHFVLRNTSAALLGYPPLSIGDNYISDFKNIAGDLAEKWVISDDWSSITITLKKGVLSSAGNELTADDVIYKFQRSEALKGLGWGLSSLALQIDKASDVEKIDKYTFKINGKSPTVLMEHFQAHDMSVLYDSTEYLKHKTEADPWSTDWASKNFVGFGPYKITEWIPGEKEVWERNENYFNPSAITGNIDKIIFLDIPESSSRLALLESGEIDIALDLSASELLSLKNNPDVRVDTHEGNHIFWMQFPSANAETPQYADVNVRKAIQFATPYKDILDRAFLGFAKQMKCTVAPVYNGYDEISKIWNTSQDLVKAKEYLSKSQWPDGFDTKVYYDASIEGQEETGILIKSALAEIGINVELVKLQTADYYVKAFGGSGFDGMNLYREMVGVPMAAFHTFLYFVKGHCCAPGGFQLDSVDALYKQQIEAIGDEATQIKIQKEIENIAWNEYPTGAPLGYLGYQVAVRKNVSGWWWQSLNELLFMKVIKK